MMVIYLLAQESGNGSAIFWGILIVAVIVLLVVFGILAQFMGLYINARFSGATVGIPDLIGMRLRKVNAAAIVRSRIQAFRAGLAVTTPEMEPHLLAGSDVQRVVAVMI